MAAVGLVIGDAAAPSAGDQALEAVLTGADHAVTLITDDQEPPGGVVGYVITESASPFSLSPTYQDLAAPVVVLEIGAWDDMGIATVGGSSDGSTDTFALETTHLITKGLPDPCVVRTSAATNWGVHEADLAPGAKVFARTSVQPSHVMGFSVDEGDALTTGAAAGPRAGLGYIDSWPTELTDNGRTLFLQTVERTLGVVPFTPGGDVALADVRTDRAVADLLPADSIAATRPVGAVATIREE